MQTGTQGVPKTQHVETSEGRDLRAARRVLKVSLRRWSAEAGISTTRLGEVERGVRTWRDHAEQLTAYAALIRLAAQQAPPITPLREALGLDDGGEGRDEPASAR